MQSSERVNICAYVHNAKNNEYTEKFERAVIFLIFQIKVNKFCCIVSSIVGCTLKQKYVKILPSRLLQHF